MYGTQRTLEIEPGIIDDDVDEEWDSVLVVCTTTSEVEGCDEADVDEKSDSVDSRVFFCSISFGAR